MKTKSNISRYIDAIRKENELLQAHRLATAETVKLWQRLSTEEKAEAIKMMRTSGDWTNVL